MDVLLSGILMVLMIVLLVGVGALLFLMSRHKAGDTNLVIPLQNLTQSIGEIQTELRGLSERVATVERNQNQVSQNLTSLGTKLVETDTVAKSLVEATSAIRTGISDTQKGLIALQTFARARQEQEKQIAASIKRLETIIAGTHTKGTAGENIIEVVFAQLPPDWQVRDFRVGNKTVEFGLRLPNNLVLPIDIKWTATHLLEQFLACEAPDEQQRLKSQIEKVVLNKAKEVKKYIAPNITVNFGVTAVPDAIYDLCSSVQVELFHLNVVLVSYSLFIPYLLLVFQTVLNMSQSVDLQKLSASLDSAFESSEAIQNELEGRFSKAITMLNNSRDDMRMHLSKISSGLTSIQISQS